MTELTITPKLSKKCASLVGRIAAGEHVSVTVVGAASLNTPTLQMRVIAGSTVIAMFPVPVEDGQTPAEWTVSGDDLVCELNLNTVQALAQCRAPETYCLFSFEELGDTNASPTERCPQLYFVAPHPVLCWPKRKPSDTPFDFDDYPSTFRLWQWQISNIAASVTKSGRTATIRIVDKNGVETVAAVDDGVGIPAGGAKGQVLVKKSSADHDTEWKDGGGGGGSIDWNDVKNKPASFPPTAHEQGWGTITGKPASFPPAAHNQEWDTITNKPTAFTPSSHAASHAAGGSDPITPASIGAVAVDSNGFAQIEGSSGAALQIGDVGGSSPFDTTITSYGQIDRNGPDGYIGTLQLPDGNGTLAKTSDLPTALSQLSGDALNRTVTDAEKTAWNGKQNALTQAQVNAVNSNITAALVAWLSAFKGADTATTVAGLLSAIGGKQDSLTFDNAPTAGSVNPVKSGGVKTALDGKVDKANGMGIVTLGDNGSEGQHALYADNAVGAQSATELNDGNGHIVSFSYGSLRWGDSIIGDFAVVADLPYSLATPPTSGTPTANTRHVLKVTATTAQTVTLPAIPNTDEILNCDIVVNGTAATADFGLTIVYGTGVSVYYPDGTGITCKAGCVTMVSCVGINGLGWLVVGCNNLKTAS